MVASMLRWPCLLTFRSAGLCQIQPFFRRNALYRGGGSTRNGGVRGITLSPLCPFFARYGFWALNRFLLQQLYFLNRRRRHFGRRSASSANDADAFTRVYGSAAPSTLPESTEWWRRQSRELFANVDGLIISDALASDGASHNDSAHSL